MGRILLKGKKLGGLLGKTESWTSFSYSSDESESAAGGGGNKKESKKDPGRVSPDMNCFLGQGIKSCSQFCKLLEDCVV